MQKQTVNINWYPGHMEKAKRQMQEQLKLVDIIIELRDARMPFSSANPLLKSLGQGKPRLIVLTKKDLSDETMTDKWLKVLNEETMTIAINSFDKNASNQIVNEVKEILKTKIERAKARGIRKKMLRALVCGIPNVGKSTLINAITKKKTAKVENRPGVTKSLQWIRIHEDLELLDTPGVLWPKFEDQDVAYRLAVLASISDRILDKEAITIFGLEYLKNYYPDILEKRYDIKIEDRKAINLIDEIALSKKWLKSGGEIDYDKTYDMFLADVRNNNIGKITWDYVE